MADEDDEEDDDALEVVEEFGPTSAASGKSTMAVSCAPIACAMAGLESMLIREDVGWFGQKLEPSTRVRPRVAR